MDISKVETNTLDDLSLMDIEKYVKSQEKEKISNKVSNRVSKKAPQKAFFSILNNYGALTTNKKADIYFTQVDWNGYIRFDIRHWSEDLTIPQKGITLTDEELETLVMTEDKAYLGNEKRITYRGGKLNADIYNCICTLSSYEDKNGKTWTKEANIVDWRYGKKIDIRFWTENYDKCSKGISLTVDEYNKFLYIAKGILLGNLEDASMNDKIEELSNNDTQEEYIDSFYNEKESMDLYHFLNTDQYLEKLFRMLSYRERTILEKRYGLIDGNSSSTEDLALYFNVTKDRIMQIEAKSLEMLISRIKSYFTDCDFNYDEFINDCKNIETDETYYDATKDIFVGHLADMVIQ